MLKKENNVVPFLVQITHSREPIVGLSKTWRINATLEVDHAAIRDACVKYQLRNP